MSGQDTSRRRKNKNRLTDERMRVPLPRSVGEVRRLIESFLSVSTSAHVCNHGVLLPFISIRPEDNKPI